MGFKPKTKLVGTDYSRRNVLIGTLFKENMAQFILQPKNETLQENETMFSFFKTLIRTIICLKTKHTTRLVKNLHETLISFVYTLLLLINFNLKHEKDKSKINLRRERHLFLFFIKN